ncbi:MAG: VWA domain-containing protein [Acidobacteriota bacterium]
MKWWIRSLILAATLPFACFAQQPIAPGAPAPAIQAHVDEVVLDLVVRDKKGRLVTDLNPDEITVSDNGAKQNILSFRLVQGSEAISRTGTTKLDPLRQLRLVTLAFESMAEADRRKTARTAALDLIQGDQGANVFYCVVAIHTRLLILQPFTSDKSALAAAIGKATAGTSASRLVAESEAIQAELKKQSGEDTKGALAKAMLDMLRLDAASVSSGARLSLTALKSMVAGLQPIPGRKPVVYFSPGLYLGSELDVMFGNLKGMANRANVTFYTVDARGLMTASQNAGATAQLNGAASASSITVNRTSGATTKAEVMASDNAENSGRADTQLRIRELAEATGGFLIGDSNDLRGPLRRVHEEIGTYYEVTFNPGIQNYDGSFRKLTVTSGRRDLAIHARTGYFALPAEARTAGLEAFEAPLLQTIAEGKLSDDVKYRAGAVLLQPRAEGSEVSLLLEVPLHELQPKSDPGKATLDVHCLLGGLVKDASGNVVEKLTRDRAFQVTAEQLKRGNFIEKMQVVIPPGKYTFETAVLDREGGNAGMQRTEFTVLANAKGVGISSLTAVRSYTPDAKDLDPAEPFQFQGGSITPTLNTSVARAEGAALRLFFIVYPDAASKAKPTVEIEFLQNGKSLTKVPMELPAADAQGKIPYVMTIPAAAIPAGTYQVRAVAKQGAESAETQTEVMIGK